VVADVKEDRFNFRIDRPVWYLPYAQQPATTSLHLVVRSAGDPAAMASLIRRAVRSLDPQQPISNLMTMTEKLSDLLVTERFAAVLMAALALLGLFLSACGLYGVIAYSASQRTGEIGLRMALGADRRSVLRLVMGSGVMLVAIGLAAGCVAARAVSVLLSSSLYGVTANDPETFVAVGAVLAAVGLVACYLPANRATHVDPLVALRST